MTRRVAVVLSGCGVMDGSEIQESVLTLLALAKAGAQAICCAPNSPQADVINHLYNERQIGESRTVLVEAARIARGEAKPLAQVLAGEIDAVILPGGYGVAKNLSTFAARGAECEVNSDLARLLRDVHAASKPIGAICIAPVVVARVLGPLNHKPRLKPRLTIGNDAKTARAIEDMGAQHVDCRVDEVVVDEVNHLVSTPAYMLAKSPVQVEAGITRLVAEVLRMCHELAVV